MSMMLMVKAMQSKVGNPLRKLVLIKLADNANDQGECWPSYQHIADQCEMSKRSVMTHIDALIECGFLRKEIRIGGQKGNKSNLYTLRIPSAGDSLPSATAAPPSAGDSPPPSAGAAPRTSHSLEPINEPVMEPKKAAPKNNKKNADQLSFHEWPCLPKEQVFNDWMAQRKAKRAPVTQTVIDSIGKELTKSFNDGYDVDECLSEAVSAGWQSFRYDWYLKRIGSSSKGFDTNKARSQIGAFLND